MKGYQNTHCYSPVDSYLSLLLIAPRCQHLLQCAHNLCGQLTVSTPTSSRSRARIAAIFGSEVLWMIFSTMDISSSLFFPSSRFIRSIASEICFMHSLRTDAIEQRRDTSIVNVVHRVKLVWKIKCERKSISKLQMVIEKKWMGIMTYKQDFFFNVISIQI